MRKEPIDKILEVLEKYGELNISRITRYTGMNYRVVARYLKQLVDQGVLEERRYGRLRLFRLRKKH